MYKSVKGIPKTSGIYCIINITNNKIYIGSAVNIYKRLCRHIGQLKNSIHSNRHLQSAWDQYGRSAFNFDILAVVENSYDLVEFEQYYLDKYKSYDSKIGYNIYRYAQSPLGSKHTEETKLKISEAKKKLFLEHPETKISGERHYRYGKKYTCEERLKLRENSPYRLFRCNETGEIFKRKGDFHEKTGIHGDAPGRVLRGEQKKSHGYTFSYIEESL